MDDEHIVVNVQGDEPLIPPAVIDQVAGNLAANPAAGIATLREEISTIEELVNPNAVKVVSNEQGMALYFSRAISGSMPTAVHFFTSTSPGSRPRWNSWSAWNNCAPCTTPLASTWPPPVRPCPEEWTPRRTWKRCGGFSLHDESGARSAPLGYRSGSMVRSAHPTGYRSTI
jgi:hypothetical protein